jgi:hypothetical protein
VPAFLYHCPVTSRTVQGWVSDEADNDALRPVICTACQRTHLIDPKSGRAAQKRNPDLPG